MRYLEDFVTGQKFSYGTLRVDEERIKRFAAQFDPQPFHPEDKAARASLLLEVRNSNSRPRQGLVKLRTTTLNQNNEAVQVSVGNLVVPCRPKPT
jgi:acyl dehydratase